MLHIEYIRSFTPKFKNMTKLHSKNKVLSLCAPLSFYFFWFNGLTKLYIHQKKKQRFVMRVSITCEYSNLWALLYTLWNYWNAMNNELGRHLSLFLMRVSISCQYSNLWGKKEKKRKGNMRIRIPLINCCGKYGKWLINNVKTQAMF